MIPARRSYDRVRPADYEAIAARTLTLLVHITAAVEGLDSATGKASTVTVEPIPSDPAEATLLLAKQARELTAEVALLSANARTSRRLMRGLALSVVFDVILSIVLGVVAWQANDTANKASEASSVLRVQCLAANESNSKQRELWEFVINLSAGNTQTADEAAQTAEFRAFMNDALPVEDCP